MKYKFFTITTVFALLISMISLQADSPSGMNSNPIVNLLEDKSDQGLVNFGTLDDDVNNLIASGHTGSVVLVVKDGTIVKKSAYGYEVKYQQGANIFDDHQSILLPEADWDAMQTDTLFDMASVTKALSTNLALQKLVYEGKLNVNDLVSTYIPEYKDYPEDLALLSADKQITGKNTTTVKDLLQHTAGQFPDPQYHNDNYLQSAKAQADFGFLELGKAHDLMFSQVDPINRFDRTSIIDAICHTPLIATPKTEQRYSDVDYMLLGLIVENIVGMPIDQYVESQIYTPLGLINTMYNPLDKGVDPSRIAATEINGNTRDGYRTPTGVNVNEFSFSNIRNYTLRGEVHDEKAWYSLGGSAGHAGLFSTAEDIAVLMQLVLNNGTYNGVTLFDKATVDLFMKPGDTITKDGFLTNNYGLGWYVNDLDYVYGGHGWGSYFSSYASYTTFGHQGWTGPVAYADPINNVIVVYMRNRPHNPVVSAAKPNSFMNAGTGSQTYGMIASHVYVDGLGKTQMTSSLPEFAEPLGNITHEFSSGAKTIEVSFIDPVLKINAQNIGPRFPRVYRVDVGAAAPSLPTGASDAGWTALKDPDWSTSGGVYTFQAEQAGDYYISLFDDPHGSMIKWVTINPATQPTSTPSTVTPVPTKVPTSIISIPNTSDQK